MEIFQCFFINQLDFTRCALRKANQVHFWICGRVWEPVISPMFTPLQKQQLHVKSGKHSPQKKKLFFHPFHPMISDVLNRSKKWQLNLTLESGEITGFLPRSNAYICALLPTPAHLVAQKHEVTCNFRTTVATACRFFFLQSHIGCKSKNLI